MMMPCCIFYLIVFDKLLTDECAFFFIVNVYFLPLFPSPDCNGNPFLVAEATEAAKKDCNGKREKAPKKNKA